jgi:uncharacterized membrane protein
MNWSAFIHVVHILAAGIWLGGLVFTTVVVTPAFKRMDWTPAERIAVRSAVGRQYSKVARINLLLLLAAVADASAHGWRTAMGAEVVLIVLVFILSEMHARIFAPRLGQAARSGDESARRRALRTSISVSMLNLVLSFVVAVVSIQAAL